jgi:Fic family protein
MHIPKKPPRIADLLTDTESISQVIRLLNEGVGPAPGGKYRHWDTLRRMPAPPDTSHLQWWAAIKLARSQTRRTVSGLLDKAGREFHYTMPDPLLELLHFVDSYASGQIKLPDLILNRNLRDRYIQSSLIEEAITSSQLEGAATTRRNAKEMIRLGRRPGNTHEQMILNNYHAMREIRRLTGEKLSIELIVHIHRILVHQTIEESHTYFRKENDGVIVRENATGNVLHVPPPASELQERLQKMCDFANQTQTDAFLHPIIKAIILHFWLAYDHPFVDGNGRTARGLFYWSMLSQEFWMAEFVSISTIIRKGPARYGRAFLYTETDESDLTYFILNQLAVIRSSIEELFKYLRHKADQQNRIVHVLRSTDSLNHRQVALLTHAVKNSDAQYTFASHGMSHGVTYETSRTDILELVSEGYLVKRQEGRKFVFRPVPDLAEKLSANQTIR